MKKRALIVGSAGQDGRILYDFLVANRYHVVGIERKRVRSNEHIFRRPVDIRTYEEVASLIRAFNPQEIYFLAAFHHSSQDAPMDNRALLERSYDVHVRSLMNFLEAMRKYSAKARLFYAASSHIFGGAENRRQDEQTAVAPTDIYGLTKAAGLFLCRLYRARYSLYAVAGILYNHESQFRASHFVSRKIIQGAVAIQKGSRKKMLLGDLDAAIDWGYAPDYVEAMRRILQLKKPDDFVIATGQPHTVRDFAATAFGLLGLDWRKHVRICPEIVTKKNFFRVGNPRKLKRMTGWKPSVTFPQMIRLLLAQEGAFHGKS